jgi:hypothetical protein
MAAAAAAEAGEDDSDNDEDDDDDDAQQQQQQEDEEDLPELTGQLKWLYHLTSTKDFFKPCKSCSGARGGEHTS